MMIHNYKSYITAGYQHISTHTDCIFRDVLLNLANDITARRNETAVMSRGRGTETMDPGVITGTFMEI